MSFVARYYGRLYKVLGVVKRVLKIDGTIAGRLWSIFLMIKKIPVLLVIIVFALTGCEALDAALDAALVASVPETCEKLAPDILDLSENNTNPFGIQILKLYEIEEVSKTETRLECTAVATTGGSGDRIPIKFEAYSDQDGDVFIGYNAVD
jgi:hypothetical protein